MNEIDKIRNFYQPNIELPENKRIVFTCSIYGFPSFDTFKYFMESFHKEYNMMPQYFVINRDYLYSVRGWIKGWELADQDYFLAGNTHYANIVGTQIHGATWMDRKHVVMASFPCNQEFLTMYELLISKEI